jgi:hypothetical protein
MGLAALTAGSMVLVWSENIFGHLLRAGEAIAELHYVCSVRCHPDRPEHRVRQRPMRRKIPASHVTGDRSDADITRQWAEKTGLQRSHHRQLAWTHVCRGDTHEICNVAVNSDRS